MNPWITFLLTALTAVGSSYGTYYFAIRSKREEAKLKAKEEKYLSLLSLLQGFVGQTANATTKKAFFQEYYQAWLYSSDDVILAIKRMVDSVRVQTPGESVSNGREIVGNIVKAMRRDLHGATKLDASTFEYIDVIDRPR